MPEAATRTPQSAEPMTAEAVEYQLLLGISSKLRHVPTSARDRITRQLITHAQSYESSHRLGLLQNIQSYANSQTTLKEPVIDHTLENKLEDIGRLFNVPAAHLHSACQRGVKAPMLN